MATLPCWARSSVASRTSTRAKGAFPPAATADWLFRSIQLNIEAARSDAYAPRRFTS